MGKFEFLRKKDRGLAVKPATLEKLNGKGAE
jgi:hypothetical protein